LVYNEFMTVAAPRPSVWSKDAAHDRCQ
jgi:hypothetical protein